MQMTTGGLEPAQQSIARFVHEGNIARQDVDALSRRNRLLTAFLGDPNVIAGELFIDNDDHAGRAVEFEHSENGERLLAK